MPRFPQRIWLAGLLVAWAVDFLFWDKPAGISFLLFFLLALAAGFLLARFEQVRPAPLSFVLAALSLALAAATLTRAEPMTRFIDGALAMVGLALLVRTFLTGGWIRFRVISYIAFWIDLLVTGLSRSAGLPLIPKGQNESVFRIGMRRAIPYVRGVFLALPVVILLAALLASADLVFADQLNEFLRVFDLSRLPEYLLRLTLILVMAYLFTSLYFQAVVPSSWVIRLPGDEKLTLPGATPAVEPAVPAEGSPVAPVIPGQRFLGPTEAFILLGSINLLFAFFVAIQFRYLFGGTANITAAGYTFSEYARRGFFELVSVAVISLFLILALNAITRRESAVVGRVYILLSTLVVGQVLVILVSAFQRLLLYENAYGFTRLRVYTHIFIPWLGLLLVATILLQILRRDQYFGAALVTVVFGFALSFPLLNIDGLIARQNIARARAVMDLDGVTLLNLSDDALPALVNGFRQADQPEKVRATLGAVLACRSYRSEQQSVQPWQSYHPGIAASRRWLASADLSAFPVVNSENNPGVNLEGEFFACFQASGMD